MNAKMLALVVLTISFLFIAGCGDSPSNSLIKRSVEECAYDKAHDKYPKEQIIELIVDDYETTKKTSYKIGPMVIYPYDYNARCTLVLKDSGVKGFQSKNISYWGTFELTNEGYKFSKTCKKGTWNKITSIKYLENGKVLLIMDDND
jgi:hypothetical protein